MSISNSDGGVVMVRVLAAREPRVPRMLVAEHS
jgi:hypothetical protein